MLIKHAVGWTILRTTTYFLGRLPNLALALLITTALHSSDRAIRAFEDDKPTLSLRASPRVGLAPVDVLFVAQLKDGADDYEEFYCATIEWDWDDDTRSESTPDCEPYEPGTSKIRRRYSNRHRFD